MRDLLIIVAAGLVITAMSLPESMSNKSKQSATNNSCKQEDRR